MSSSSKQNANGEVISLGEEIHGKWSPPRTAHRTVKSFGKTKVKILLTEDFTKTHKKGMCIDIYFQTEYLSACCKILHKNDRSAARLSQTPLME